MVCGWREFIGEMPGTAMCEMRLNFDKSSGGCAIMCMAWTVDLANQRAMNIMEPVSNNTILATAFTTVL